MDQKEHIKKYYKARRIHADVTSSMMNYIDKGKLPIELYVNEIFNDVNKETNNLQFTLDNQERNDAIVFNELFMYKNHFKIPSLTEIYIENKVFKNTEKVKMLNAMRDSVVGLFKVVGYDHLNGYVVYQDVFTKKEYKIIDISMSSLQQLYEGQEIYVYNRIINYDGILFGTGFPYFFTNKCKRFKSFLKNHNYKKCSDFSRCVILYDIAKDSDNSISTRMYTNY